MCCCWKCSDDADDVHAGYVDWHAVQLQSTAELVSQVYPTQCVSTVELTDNLAAVASASPAGSVTATVRRCVERVRRTCTNQSTVSRSQTLLTQSVEHRRRLYCSLCRVKLNADQQAEQHFRGKLHSRKSKKLTPLSTTSDATDTQVQQNYTISIITHEAASEYTIHAKYRPTMQK